MTKEEYTNYRTQIIETLGSPEWDGMGGAENESARQIKALNERRSRESLKAARDKKKGITDEPKSLEAINSSIPAVYKKAYKTIPTPSLFLDDVDLKPFTPWERELLKLHYEYPDLTNKELAERFNVDTRKITWFFKDTRVQLLEARLFERNVDFEVRKSLMRALRAGDEKVTLRMAENRGIIKPEEKDLNIKSKAIDDPDIIKKLKELGDQLA